MIAENASGGSVFGDHFPAKWLCFSLSKTGGQLVRVSVQGYNTTQDVDALLDALKWLLPQVAHEH
jgi:selenocysteine lyase/cysteine desulfurase